MIYDWREFDGRPWRDRFPVGARGFDTWRQLSFQGPPLPLMAERERAPRPSRPCLFVSHRQIDIEPALRIAYLACCEGFDFWLDVLDPSLSGLPGAGWLGPGTPQKSFAIAAVIEMALLNSTHVMAVMTNNTMGSQWVPYEYGRVKDPVPASPQAACWLDSSISGVELPGYLFLGAMTTTERQVRDWLRFEREQFWDSSSESCRWTGPEPIAVLG